MSTIRFARRRLLQSMLAAPALAGIAPALRAVASAVAIGRPYIWGLASFGQAGVEKVIDILRAELTDNMRQAGTASIADINASYLVDNRTG